MNNFQISQNLFKFALLFCLLGILGVLIIISFQFGELIVSLEKIAYAVATGIYSE